MTLLSGVGLATGQAAHGPRPRQSPVLRIVQIRHVVVHRLLLTAQQLRLLPYVLYYHQGGVLDEGFDDILLAAIKDAAKGRDVDVLQRLHQVLHVVIV